MFKEDLKNSQPVIYQTLFNAFNLKHQSHAYLINGDKEQDVLDLAKFIAKSFLCLDNEVLACEKCNNCKRIDDNSFYDVHLIDGSKETIKDQTVKELKKDLTLSSLENNKSIYIIHLIENASLKTINSLLKFLEEPEDNVIAIITTNNLAKVLPTIISRCQLLRLKSANKEVFLNRMVSNGVNKEEATIVSYCYDDKINYQEVLEDKRFNKIKDYAYDYINDIFNNLDDLIYLMSTDIAKNLMNREDVSLFLDIVIAILKDLLNENSVFNFNKNLTINDIVKVLDLLYLYQGKLSSNVNVLLLLDSLSYQIRRCLDNE
ncbi:MAG: hypothetical protein SO253_01595 [Bacilli bacterium]|nr:hypothetical protein [Bacilli bacterium]